MSNKNSLANKKRKRIKFDATSGSISGFLLSSSESIEVNNSADNSLDSSETFVNGGKFIKTRLSNELDDSFDLFASKKLVDKRYERVDSVSVESSISPVETNDRIGPLKISNSACHPGKNGHKYSKGKVVKKQGYWDKANVGVVPCPFCFRFKTDFYSHLSSDCLGTSGVSDSAAALLIDIHSKYWQQRRDLGVPDFFIHEDHVFKTSPVDRAKKAEDSRSVSSWECKAPALKWNGKGKKSKYLLLRQTQEQREIKVTQKLAVLLMGGEAADGNTDNVFQTADRSVASDLLSSLSTEGMTFWKKSTLGPDEVKEDMYYIKSLAPFVAANRRMEQTVLAPSPLSNVNLQMESNGSKGINFIEENVRVANVTPDPPASPLTEKLAAVKESQVNKGSLTCGVQFECGSSGDSSKGRRHFERALSDNWERMFNSSDLSDTTVLFSDGSFSGHSLVFYSHSVKIFRSISSTSDEESGKLLDWKSVSSLAGRSYIRFVYSAETRHFDQLNASDLDGVKQLCHEYGDVSLAEFVSALIESKKSTDSSYPRFSPENRNLTSPDMFEDNDSCWDTKREAVDHRTSCKRRLDILNGNSTEECNKRVKTDGPPGSSMVEEGKGDDVVSISSEDGTSLRSVVTVSPGRYERSASRPLSQCSTLPPLPESPKTDGERCSPLVVIDTKGHRDGDENSVEGSDGAAEGSNLYYDHDSFDYNNYINYSWVEEMKTWDLTETDLNGPITATTSSAVSTSPVVINTYSDCTESCQVPCGTPQHVKGSSTPPQPVRSDSLSSPSPRIVVSDSVTPMLDYSNIISPQLKGELRKYGLKPEMDRKKAKTLLRYIYDSIHATVGDISPQSDRDVEALQKDTLATEIPQEDQTHASQESNLHTSTESVLAYSSDSMLEGGSDVEEEEEEGEEGDGVRSEERSSYLPKNQLLRPVSEFIKRDPVLLESILQYVPIWLSKFHLALKENDIKCTKVDLMDVLDELCITFRTERKSKGKNRQNR